MRTDIRRFFRDQSGATAIEYGLIVGLIALAIIATITLLGGDLSAMFTTVSTELDGAESGISAT